MPQLDQFTYFSQFVWLTVSFCVYYVVVVYSSLPKLSRILKSRARFLQNSIRRSHSTANVGWKDEADHSCDYVALLGRSPLAFLEEKARGSNLGPSSSNDTLVTDCIHSSANYLNASLTSAQAWCSQCISQFNINQLVKANRSYLKRLAEVTMLLARNTSPKKLSFERVVFIRFQRYLSFTVERASNKVSAKHELRSLKKEAFLEEKARVLRPNNKLSQQTTQLASKMVDRKGQNTKVAPQVLKGTAIKSLKSFSSGENHPPFSSKKEWTSKNPPFSSKKEWTSSQEDSVHSFFLKRGTKKKKAPSNK